MPAVPAYPHDIFNDEALAEPNEHYRQLRELGPVVWLDVHEMYVLPRYDEVRIALRDPRTFCSGQGVGLNELVNEQGRGTTLMTDGPLHDAHRRLELGTLTPKALTSIRESVQHSADLLVDDLVARGGFDGVADLARSLPLTVVPALLGWPDHDRDKLLSWAAATFDVLGPLNERARDAVPRFLEMVEFAGELARSGAIAPGSVGARILAAADRGEIPHEQVPGSLIDYLAPSMDTTISAIGNALSLFIEHPRQWRALCEDPSLIPQAFNEVLRLESPIRCFSRVTTRDVEVGGAVLPSGARVIVHYASANRDERRFQNADRFDITRPDSSAQLAFGIGTHTCPGQSLARVEVHSLLSALTRRVDTFNLAGAPSRMLNNLINGWAELPVTVRARAELRHDAPRPTRTARPAPGPISHPEIARS